MSAPGADPQVIVLRRYADFLALEPEWNALFAAAERPAVFLSHRWLRLSWQHAPFHALTRLRVVVVRERGELVMGGVFVAGFRRLVPVLRLLSSGTPQTEDLLWRPSPRIVAHAALVLDALRRDRLLPARLRLERVRADSPLHAGAALLGLRSVRRATQKSYAIPIGRFPDFGAYFAALSGNLRHDHSRRLRRLAEAGAVYAEQTGPAAATALDWLFARKREWLDETERRAPWLASGHVDRFMAELHAADDAPPHFVSTLHLGGNLIAASLCYAERDVVRFSKVAHDPAFGQLSPGRTVTLQMVERAMGRGCTLVELGNSGREWKTRIGAEPMDIVTQKIRLR